MLTNERPIDNIVNNDFHSDIDNIRTVDDIYNRLLESKTNNGGQRNVDETGSCSLIFRYKFTEEFMNDLYKFSKIHQYDHRKDFKEAWKLWVEENEDIINQESLRLQSFGYEGDVLDKMFKSARYYFRKKSVEKKEPKQRRQYISINRELLDAMDCHIEENTLKENYQPKTGFLEFCEANKKLISETINGLNERNVTDNQLIEEKIKKTYKNRYFIYVAHK
jgi:hypothetical protein